MDTISGEHPAEHLHKVTGNVAFLDSQNIKNGVPSFSCDAKLQIVLIKTVPTTLQPDIISPLTSQRACKVTCWSLRVGGSLQISWKLCFFKLEGIWQQSISVSVDTFLPFGQMAAALSLPPSVSGRSLSNNDISARFIASYLE